MVSDLRLWSLRRLHRSGVDLRVSKGIGFDFWVPNFQRRCNFFYFSSFLSLLFWYTSCGPYIFVEFVSSCIIGNNRFQNFFLKWFYTSSCCLVPKFQKEKVEVVMKAALGLAFGNCILMWKLFTLFCFSMLEPCESCLKS